MLILNLKTNRQVVALILPVTLVFLLILLSFTQFFITHNHNLSIAITLDLIFSIPLIHVVLSTRSSNLKYSTALFFTAGLIVASFIIPKNNQFLLHEVKVWVVPVIEFCGIVFFVIQTKKIRSKHASLKKNSDDFYTVFKQISKDVLPARLASIITAEISAFYYGFFNWRKVVYDNKTFSYHKKTGTISLIGVFIFMILIEASVFHLLLQKWSGKVAWVVSGLSFYAVLQAFGILRSILKRPIQINDSQLVVPYGILAETAFDLTDIASVEIYNKVSITGENLRGISPFKKIEEPDIILNLTKAYYIEGIYGKKKAFDQLLINVDEKEVFLKQLQLLTASSTG
ncbi:hypothetical protein JN11_00763 [Mucilaginibacter frigoritolerans]|uniref:Uncharacterized protein n=1 Tax=Mucilaginibacter frigoritolerans TaxID=652788 RepID=A0A562UBS6_9SPHI|nr:hypothetical protein [Mucilaginibacter frigoritolerans]TWJ03226.1 hypothetical protein JN11_00763 [Mucilaginibacter frigoritolerans]